MQIAKKNSTCFYDCFRPKEHPMDYRQLGRTDLNVSAICLGTMTWGEQNSEAEAFAQIERAKAAGINFIDTAEMYPVPPKADTYATTERYIGNYFKRRGDRATGSWPARSPAPATPSTTSATAICATTASTSPLPWTPASSACRPTRSTSTSCTGRNAAPTSSANWATSTRTKMTSPHWKKPSKRWTSR